MPCTCCLYIVFIVTSQVTAWIATTTRQDPTVSCVGLASRALPLTAPVDQKVGGHYCSCDMHSYMCVSCCVMIVCFITFVGNKNNLYSYWLFCVVRNWTMWIKSDTRPVVKSHSTGVTLSTSICTLQLSTRTEHPCTTSTITWAPASSSSSAWRSSWLPSSAWRVWSTITWAAPSSDTPTATSAPVSTSVAMTSSLRRWWAAVVVVRATGMTASRWWWRHRSIRSRLERNSSSSSSSSGWCCERGAVSLTARLARDW